MIYGLFVLIGGLATLFFLFNTGQLAREKTKLVNTADAVAYSAAVMDARGLNFAAYTNRAMIANSVAVAQLVSLASWVRYTGALSNYGYTVADPLRYPLFYIVSYLPALAVGQELQAALNDSGALEALASASDHVVRDLLMDAQQVAHLGLVTARAQVMNEVARANYRNDGAVEIDVLRLDSDYPVFVERRAGAQRTRFAEATQRAANLDGFVSTRSWSVNALWPLCITALPRTDRLDRRGGTALVGFDEWKALDTLSEKRWVPKNKSDPFCSRSIETPAAWGAQSAADQPSEDTDPALYDHSVAVNPLSSSLALTTSGSWGYGGLPSFHELSDAALAQEDPRLPFAIRLRRSQTQTATSESLSRVPTTARLNAYRAHPAGGDQIVAVAASEVFFRRDGAGADNVHGNPIGRPFELASLFNPYWQVRLVQADAQVRQAQALQGAEIP